MDDDNFRKLFSKRLRHYMWIRDMSQAELAKKSGVSQTCVSRYLSGLRTPSGYCMAKLAAALGCSVGDLTRE